MVFLIEEMKLSVSEKHPVFITRPKKMDVLESSVGNLLSRKSPVAKKKVNLEEGVQTIGDGGKQVALLLMAFN